MAEDIFVATAPQLGVNDLEMVLTVWHAEDGAWLSHGQVLCELETTKASFDMEAETAGHLLQLVPAGSQIEVSQSIALIGPDLAALRQQAEQHRKQLAAVASETVSRLSHGRRVTEKAKRLMEKLGIEPSSIAGLGIVRERDVIEFHQATKAVRSERPSQLSWALDHVPVAVYGAGRGGVTVKECLHMEGNSQVVCFVDDNPQRDSLDGVPVYHISALSEIQHQGVTTMACAIANAEARLRILRLCEGSGLDLMNVIHPRAYVSPTARMGKGNYVKAGAVIETNTKIGNCCIVDNGAVVAHDNVIEDGVHIAPGVSLGSSVRVGERAIIGIGAAISTGVRIGKSVIVSVGSAVIRDVPDLGVVEGVPAKMIGDRRGAGDRR